jgi:uncharacterized protein DUF5671
MPDKLQAFIRHARDKGLDHGTIHNLLSAAGWKEREIAGAIAGESLDLPVPKPAGTLNARDAFLHLLMFASLYITVSSAVLLFYTYLDHIYPDPAWGDWHSEAALASVRYAIAAIFVGLPLFVSLSMILDRVGKKEPDGQTHPARTWLTYLTLFVAAAIAVGDLITLLYFFLDGALTTRFVLKVIVLLVMAGLVLAYYLLSLYSVTKRQGLSYLRRFLAAAGLLVVATAVVAGFDMAGSPFSARLRHLDETRVKDLRAIHDTVQQMVTKPDRNTDTVTAIRALPKTLEDVAEFQRTRQTGRKLDIADPETGDKYGYTVTGDKTYELSATFELPREKKQDLFWNHPAGKHVFKFNVESPP